MEISKQQQPRKFSLTREDMLSVPEAAVYLRCSTTKIYALKKEGKIKQVGSGGRDIYFWKHELDSFLNGGSHNG